MFKAIFLIKRRPDMTREEFTRHYYETHIPLVLKIPGLKKYVTNEVKNVSKGVLGGSESELECDRVAEGWFESKKRPWKQALLHPLGKRIWLTVTISPT